MRAAIMALVMVGAVGGQLVGQTPTRSTFIEPKTLLWQAAPTPDGKSVVTVTGDERTLRVFDIATGKAQTWKQGAADAGSVAFAPDGKTVLVGRRDGTVSSHDLATGRELASVPVGEKGKEKEPFFPLAAGSYGEPVFALSSDGELLALGNPNALTVALVKWPGGGAAARLRNEPKDGEGYASPAQFGAGKTLYCLCGGEARGFVAVWDVATRKRTQALVPPRTVSLMAVSPDGRWVGVGGPFNRAVTVWDAESDFKQTDLPIPGGNCKGIAFSRDGKRAATVSTAMEHKKATAVVWDLATRRAVRSWPLSDDFWLGGIVFFSRDGQTLFTGGQLEGLYAWDLSAPEK